MADMKTACQARVRATITLAAGAVLQPGAVNCVSVPVPGLRTNMLVHVNKPTSDDGIFLVGARVSAADTLEICLWNTTGAAHSTVSQDYFVVGF
jgi:hypothetical protein